MTRKPADQRSVRRAKTFAVATLGQDGADQRIHILNASPLGALIHSRGALRAGTTITLGIGAARALAYIVWVAGEKAGVRFASPLSDRDVATLLEGAPAAAVA